MKLNFKFAIISDLHVALPHTVWDHPSRFHLVEISIPALEHALDHLSHLDLDFLLMPGDLTQHGEVDNHRWLADRLSQLPYPVYVIPGNHDVPILHRTEQTIGLEDFATYYHQFGYSEVDQLYYAQEILPHVHLVGLNSNWFDDEGKQIGRVDDAQLAWLEAVLAKRQGDLILVMIHHNIVEHLPGQSRNPLGRRYMLENARNLRHILRQAGVQLVFTGHLHVQDIAYQNGIYDITTGSLVTYPHPYRILTFCQDAYGRQRLQIESHRVETVPGWDALQHRSRNWMGDRSLPFVMKLLTHPPLNVPIAEAEALAPDLRYFWADIANGDPIFNFSHFPASVRHYFEAFSAIDPHGYLSLIDNNTTLLLQNAA